MADGDTSSRKRKHSDDPEEGEEMEDGEERVDQSKGGDTEKKHHHHHHKNKKRKTSEESVNKKRSKSRSRSRDHKKYEKRDSNRSGDHRRNRDKKRHSSSSSDVKEPESKKLKHETPKTSAQTLSQAPSQVLPQAPPQIPTQVPPQAPPQAPPQIPSQAPPQILPQAPLQIPPACVPKLSGSTTVQAKTEDKKTTESTSTPVTPTPSTNTAASKVEERKRRLEQWRLQQAAKASTSPTPVNPLSSLSSLPPSQAPILQSPPTVSPFPQPPATPPTPTALLQPPPHPQPPNVVQASINTPAAPSTAISTNIKTEDPPKPPAPSQPVVKPIRILPKIKPVVRVGLSLTYVFSHAASFQGTTARQTTVTFPEEKPILVKLEPLPEQNQSVTISNDTSQDKKPEEQGSITTTDTSTEIDELDRYMSKLEKEAKQMVEMTQRKIARMESKGFHKQSQTKSTGPERFWEDSEEPVVDISDDDDDFVDSDDDKPSVLQKKKKNLSVLDVDHGKVQYRTFRSDFYIEVPEISKLSAEEVTRIRSEELEGCQVKGKNCPKPIRTWAQCGLSSRVLEIISKKCKFDKPTPIQRQAIPAIMSGRDIIGCAKTGSGKTMAFVLPMLRHVLDQPPLETGDGPIALIMAPTRELAQQIYLDTKRFTKHLGVTCVAVYGGAGIADQIGDLKRGAQIVVCTPGRMIDILCSNAGRITNLKRVTYLVMDEADRMFDLGFEPQIMRIVDNIRPDRQTVMFSATFPFQVELAARKILKKPLEIICGGRSVACKDVTQLVEVLPDEDSKFKRLLQLVHEWYERGQILIFVDRQSAADKLFQELVGANYSCLVLHGGIDQKDRASTLSDFKRGERNIMVATSVCARGIDVKGLELVINFDVPDHMEDYVHRVGRTGRAGRKGTAYTFVTPDKDRYAPDLVKALIAGEQQVPESLQEMADEFSGKKQSGKAKGPNSGYGGHGFKFDDSEQKRQDDEKRRQKLLYGFGEDEEIEEREEEEEGAKPSGIVAAAAALVAAVSNPGAPVPTPAPTPVTLADGRTINIPAPAPQKPMEPELLTNVHIPLSLTPGLVAAQAAGETITDEQRQATQKATAFVAQLNALQNLQKLQNLAAPTHFEEELEINDYPQNARWKVTHREALAAITEWTGAAVTTRGAFTATGKNPPPGERKLYLFIEGPTAESVSKAKKEIKRILEENAVLYHTDTRATGRYNVMS